MNAVLGLGNDLVEVERIAALHQKYGNRFLEFVYTPQECTYCFSQKNPYPSLAARFAAKEAVSKAFGVGIGGQLTWRSIAVGLANQSGPFVITDEKANSLLKKLGGKNILITLTHTRTLAQAVAIIVG